MEEKIEAKNLLKVKDIAGVLHEIEIDVTTDLTVHYANGDEKVIKLTKAAPRDNVNINDMTIDELRIEIRNSHSVWYKSDKKVKDAQKTVDSADAIVAAKKVIDDAEATTEAKAEAQKVIDGTKAVSDDAKKAAQAIIDKADKVKLAEQEKRYNDAKTLFETKFPGQSLTIGSTSNGKTNNNKNADKITAITGIIETIKAADLPEEVKKANLDKLNSLLEGLNKPNKKDEKKDEAKDATEANDATEAKDATKANVEENPTADSAADTSDVPTEALPKGRRGSR